MNAEQLQRFAMNAAEDIGGKLSDPEDDWDPVVLMAQQDHLAIGRLGWSTDEGRDVVIYEVVKLIKENRATAVAFVLSSWSSDSSGGKEVLMVVSVDANSSKMSYAEITRDPLPKLGGWEDADVGTSIWADAVRPAVIRNTAAMN